jgi:transcriptional regulator with GAF, ATPase, and Fis domain
MGSNNQAGPVLEHLVFQVAQGIAREGKPRFFESLVRNLAQALPADFVFAGALDPEENRIVTLASFGDGPQQAPREFDLADTPFCNLTPENADPVSCSANAAERFPNDPILRNVPGDGYVAAPLVDSAGNLLGLMSAVTRHRLEDPKVAEELVRIFSGLAARQLESAKQIRSLERQNAEFRRAAEEGSASKSHPERDVAYLRDEIRMAHPPGIGNSPEFRALLNNIRRVAPTSGIVLIQGETGTGKELTARAIHNQSSRRNRPLVKLDCVTTPPEMLEVELFGGLRDPRSEAAPRIGRLDFADGGTLLIDEVGALPLDIQAKLLRVIQQHEFRPLGFPHTNKVDIRLLATTNRDLELAVKEERFRSDLYQRLMTDTVHVPPLRRRRQDIPLLAERVLHILERRLSRPGLRMSDRMTSQMMTYSWPGNIRELEHLLFRAALTGDTELDLPVHAAPVAAAEPITLQEAERQHVLRTLATSNWVIEGPRGAAAALAIPPSTLRSLMKRLQIQRVGKPNSVNGR